MKTEDHKTVKDLSPQFRKPNMKAVVNSICDLLEESEKKAQTLLDFLNLKSKRRDTLEATAKILAIKEDYEDLEKLRERIQGEIAINNSNGSIPDLINIIKTLFNLKDTRVHSMPGMMRLETTDKLTDKKARSILNIANQAASAGLGIDRILHGGSLKLDAPAGLDSATLADETEVIR